MTHSKMYNIQIKTNKLGIRLVALFLSCTILFPTFSITSNAAIDNSVLKQSIYEATALLESAIELSLSESETAVKKRIVENEYDYYTTMETFYRCDNPYTDADYLELLASYMVAKENTNTLDSSSFYHLPFVQETIETSYSWEYIPVEVIRYLDNGDGTYYESGKTYITEPQTITTYKKTADGSYVPSGTRDISPEKKSTKYGDVTLQGIDASGILSYYGLDNALMEDVQKIKEKFAVIVNGNGLKQSMFLESPKTDLLDPKTINYIESLLEDENIDLNRKYLIDAAVSLVGKVPYEWGGKASGAGYDTSWWTIDDTGKQKGLDCSGFVQWAFMSAGFNQSLYDKMFSTESILTNTETINKSELQAGDLGLLNNGQEINHVGIYLGNGFWVHCSSAEGTVTVEKTEMFKIFKQMPKGTGNGYTGNPVIETPKSAQGNNRKETAESQEMETFTQYRADCPFSDAEIYLTAQLVYNEAASEGINGWVAVAEIVLNRVDSELFADSIEGVIYEKGQFSNSNMIKIREPSDEMIAVVKEVLSGNMKVLNSKDVLFFRNAGGSTEDWGEYEYFGTINSHQFYKY